MNLEQERFFTKPAPLWPITGARIIIGVLWLYSLRWKLPLDFIPLDNQTLGLKDWMQLMVDHPSFAFYAEFVEFVVLPNFILFAWLVFLGELFVGLSLLTGTLTRLGAFLGLVMSLNLGIGMLEVPGEWPWSYAMLAMWHGVFLITAAGRLLGFDARFRKIVFPPWWVRAFT